MPDLTTGVPALDDLIDGVRVGDNLVFVTVAGAPGQWVVDRFVDAADRDRLVIADATGRHADADAAHVLDWSAGRVSAEQARAQLERADRAVGRDALFAVDSLTDLAVAWGEQEALDLFLWACPRLFHRGSVALWLVDGDRHDDAFVRRLSDITQVVVEISATGDDGVRLRVARADGRPPTVTGRTVAGHVVGGRPDELGPVVPDRRRFGEMLRELRVSRGVGQAELARRIGISPSALSQAERGIRGISADTLMRLYETLGVPLADAVDPHGYRVTRRSSRRSTTVAGGVTGRASGGEGLTVWHLTFAPRSSGRQALFPVKAREVVTVLRGVLEVEVGGQRLTLHEGDSLDATDAVITAWANPADTPAEVMWAIGGRSAS